MADNQTELEAQLLMPRYKINKGRIFVEAKDDIKARLGRSPDNADAFIYAMAGAVNAATQVGTIERPPTVNLDPRRLGGRNAGVTNPNRLIHVNADRQRFGIETRTGTFR